MLIERAGLWIAQENWNEAEKDLDAFLRLVQPPDYPPRFWTRACLARGFLHERKNESDLAREVWKRGTPKSHPSLAWTLDRYCPMSLVQTSMLAGLCNELTDADAEIMTGRLMQQMGGIIQGTGLKSALQFFLPELAPQNLGPMLREVWHTEEGRRIAQQVAFRERRMPEL